MAGRAGLPALRRRRPRGTTRPPRATATKTHGFSVARRDKIRRGRLKSTHTYERIQIGLEMYGGDPFILRRRQFNNPLESDVRSIHRPLHTVTANATDIALIVPDGRDWRRAYHRALSPLELKRAMSLPDDYVLYGTATEQVRQIGNAVPVRTAKAHVQALLAA